ncbi:hypothetical protein GE09DRAFT_1273460 [Coniochaeta sp. 2T2.1]|nr:hypothetical protein GE09DRAFT_1273460 [Coniochaeta sp. 2T2.1]
MLFALLVVCFLLRHVTAYNGFAVRNTPESIIIKHRAGWMLMVGNDLYSHTPSRSPLVAFLPQPQSFSFSEDHTHKHSSPLPPPPHLNAHNLCSPSSPPTMSYPSDPVDINSTFGEFCNAIDDPIKRRLLAAIIHQLADQIGVLHTLVKELERKLEGHARELAVLRRNHETTIARLQEYSEWHHDRPKLASPTSLKSPTRRTPSVMTYSASS